MKQSVNPDATHAGSPSGVKGNDVLPMAIALIEEGHTVTIPLGGNSMRPFLVHGRDKAILARPTAVGVGQPVLAEVTPGHYVLHRIVAIEGESVTLRGDGNIAAEHCRLSDVRALAVGFIRNGRAKPDCITGRKWRVYSWLWTRLLPLRRRLLQLHNLFFRSLKPLE